MAMAVAVAATASMATALASKRILCRIGTSKASPRCASALSSSSYPSRPELARRVDRHKLPSRVLVCQGQGNRRRHGADATPARRHLSGQQIAVPERHEGAARNKSLLLHPAGHGRHILPGDVVLKEDPRTGAPKQARLEHALGYFWALKDLQLTDNKPLLSNEALVPAAEAEKFPRLTGLVDLRGDAANVPDFFLRNNRSKDANAQCTLVAVSYKDFGTRLLPSWTEPFEEALCDEAGAGRCEVARLYVNEGWTAWLLKPLITAGARRHVPARNHGSTLLYFGDAARWRDVLRMHNTYTGYVFLVDGIGRVRWAGSGAGSEEETRSLIELARELTRPTGRGPPPAGPQLGRRGRRVPRRG